MAEKKDALCYVCCEEEAEGTFFSCTGCSIYFHLECYVPALKKAPSVDRECLLCYDKDYFNALPNERTSSSGKMTVRDLHLSRRLLLEMYGVEDKVTGKRAAKPFRKMETLEFKSYKMFIRKPIALDKIKRKLDKENPNQYTSLPEVIHDFRRMFINCRTYWGINHTPSSDSLQSGTIFTKYASILEKTLLAKIEELTNDDDKEHDYNNNKKQKSKKRKDTDDSDSDEERTKRKKR